GVGGGGRRGGGGGNGRARAGGCLVREKDSAGTSIVARAAGQQDSGGPRPRTPRRCHAGWHGLYSTRANKPGRLNSNRGARRPVCHCLLASSAQVPEDVRKLPRSRAPRRFWDSSRASPCFRGSSGPGFTHPV